MELTHAGAGQKSSIRLRIAGTMALVADAVQLCLFPVFAEGFLSPFDDAVDVVMAIAMCCLVGFHIVFLPTFLIKETPIVDMAPTWTLAYLFVAHGEEKLTRKKTVSAALDRHGDR